MPHRSRLAVVVIDTEETRREVGVRFWGAALGRTRVADDDPATRYAQLETPPGPTLDVIVQATAPDQVGLHLDIETDDVEAEVNRLEKLGARRKRFVEEWWVMEAPSGHAFCVIPVQTDTWPEGAIEWPDAD
jgi:hypothetical protein